MAYENKCGKSSGYAVISVTTAWMKLYHPVEFEVANMNSLLGKADEIQVQLNEARHMGIKVLGPDVNHSNAEFSIEDAAIRVGLQGLKNLGKVGAKITEERKNTWSNIESFLWDMIDVLDKRAVEALAYSGALDSFGIKRKVLVENSEKIAEFLQKVRKYNALGVKEDGTELPPMEAVDEIYMRHIKPELPKYADEFSRDDFYEHELEYCGMYVSGHPLDGMSDFYINKDIVPIRQVLPQKLESDSVSDAEDENDDDAIELSFYDGRIINVLGICRSIRPITTKKGGIMYLFDIEDADSRLGIVIWPDQAEKMVKVDPMIFRKIPNKPILINGKVKTDSYGTKMTAYSIALVDDTLTEDCCPEVWVEVNDKEAMARANSIIKDFKSVPSAKNATRVVFYYVKTRAQKAISCGNYVMHFTDFLRLKSDFKVIPNCELSKLNEKQEVEGDWVKTVL